MVKSIHLKMNERMFYKLKADKINKEKKGMRALTWEQYVMLLFSFNQT